MRRSFIMQSSFIHVVLLSFMLYDYVDYLCLVVCHCGATVTGSLGHDSIATSMSLYEQHQKLFINDCQFAKHIEHVVPFTQKYVMMLIKHKSATHARFQARVRHLTRLSPSTSLPLMMLSKHKYGSEHVAESVGILCHRARWSPSTSLPLMMLMKHMCVTKHVAESFGILGHIQMHEYQLATYIEHDAMPIHEYVMMYTEQKLATHARRQARV